MTDGVFIGMPVFRGTDVIEETLRSILAQSFDDFRLLMSVDGEDDPTVEICKKYTDDPRIDLVVQPSRLGWPANFNWLVARCDREFFCYWQQDDLASTGYLENLMRELLAQPTAAIAYTDVQWFGARFDREGSPSIEGDPLSRVMQEIEAVRFEPLRGLMRASMLPSDRDAISVTDDESCEEEFVFLTQMAAAGSFNRVYSALYFKRLHGNNAFLRWAHFPDWRRRRAWISMGAGMYRIAQSVAPPDLWPRILGHVIDRLAVSRHGRAHFYLPPQTPEEMRRFVHDLSAFASLTEEDLDPARLTAEPLEAPIHPDILRAVRAERKVLDGRSELRRLLASEAAARVAPRDTGNTAILGYGWSTPESWGVWTDGEDATLRIPVPNGSSWRASIEARTYAPNGSVIVGVAADDQPLRLIEAGTDDPLVVTIESGQRSEGRVRLHLPNARAPIEDRLSGDRRKLGIGLTQVHIALT